ncbi:MAG: VCBS repeat-containing protein [Saprospiraceae bacterium]|nr:VCBS repeat-containing protein [Saprospiraceae bacterium]
MNLKIICAISLIFSLLSCTPLDQEAVAKSKYETYCGSCHKLPKIENITKSIWENDVLPEMAARMGYFYNDYDPYTNSMEENYFTRISNVYPQKQLIRTEDWNKIHDYILSHAPDSIAPTPIVVDKSYELTQFDALPMTASENSPFMGLTSIHYDSMASNIYVSDISGRIFYSDQFEKLKRRFNSPIVSIFTEDTCSYVTEIGIMNPSEIARGVLYKICENSTQRIADNLHRPVYTVPIDLDQDGVDELLICEYGHHTGAFTMLNKSNGEYQKETLISLPGSIKFEVADMNRDGRKDIVVLLGQGREGIYILYQSDDQTFDVDQVISLGPEYGSSWFELIDYNQDGYKDIVMVNGDNADYSVFLKPYHGIRLFLNDGNNQFDQKWFYPIHGATRVIAEDFDQDNDVDFAVLSFFPDFENHAEKGFIYLENKKAATYQFASFTTEIAKQGNWLIMEKGDIDKDGDIDIFLGNFPFLTKNTVVKSNTIPILLLQNNL